MKQQHAFCRAFMTSVEAVMYNGGKKLRPTVMGQLKGIHKRAGELRARISSFIDSNKPGQTTDLDGVQVALRELKEDFGSVQAMM